MTPELTVLLATAATIGVVHTLLGPDHYVPFIALARARGWSVTRAMRWTLVCGMGHVVGSISLGLLGVAFGIGVSRLEAIESTRGEIAAWMLITLGILYLAWGLHRASRHRVTCTEGRPAGCGCHAGSAAAARKHRGMTAWILFLVFVLGPCEALIPVLMYPAATAGYREVALVTGVFAVATVLTMALVVGLGIAGVRTLSFGRVERFGHAIAGAIILACGIGLRFLGL